MEPLSVRVDREGPLPVHDAVGWAVRLAKRVEELHRLGVAHGGVSANIILSDGPACRGRGILGDVRQAASRPAYHSPERHEGRGISPADDTWGAAVTLYLLLTGRMPFEGATSEELARNIASTSPAPLAVFDTGDDALQGILDRFLARPLSARTTNMGVFRQELEQWFPQATQLPPLDEGEEESLTDFDDDDEEIATVMRDFSDVRAQLGIVAGQPNNPTGAPRVGRAQGPTSGRPPTRGPAGVPGAPQPRPVPTPGVRTPAPSTRGGRLPLPHSPGVPAPRGSSPGAGAPAGAAPPPAPSQPSYGHPGAPAPVPSQPGVTGLPSYDIDDEDSDEEGATVLMDTSSQDVHAAIEAALASAPEQQPPPGWPSPADDDEGDGGQRTIGLAEAGLDFSDVPDPTGGEAPVRAGDPPAPSSPGLGAPPPAPPSPGLGAPPPAPSSPGLGAPPPAPSSPGLGAPPPAPPSPGLGAPPDAAHDDSPFRRAQPNFDPPSPAGDLAATAAFPEDEPFPFLPEGQGGAAGAPGEGGPGPAPSALAGPGEPGPVGVVPGNEPAPSPAPAPEMFVPEPEDSGGGLRTALIVATVILLLVVTGVVLLWLDRSGTIDLGI